MSVANSASNLLEALKELRLQWDRTRDYWRDTKRDEFERNYLENLPSDIARASLAMKELDAILRKIREECE